MTFRMVTDILAFIGAGACLWWAVIGFGRLLSWIDRTEIARREAETAAKRERPDAAATALEPEGIPADHLVAIAAAVAALGEGVKVVHLADAATGRAWASAGRWMHQMSHRTH